MRDVWLEQSPARKRFRQKAGYANFRLNTIVVGLEAVRKGVATRPPDLAVSWAPKNPEAAATLARGFATSAVMVFAVDALDRYMADLTSAPAFVEDEDTASVLRGDFQLDRSGAQRWSPAAVDRLSGGLSQSRSSPEGVETLLRDFQNTYVGRRKRLGLARKFDALLSFVPNVPPYYEAGVHLLISWRNRHVHRDASATLPESLLEALLAGSAYLYENHAHFDADRTVENYRKNETPTLKEISTLISILHRTISRVDQGILGQLDLDNYAWASLKQAFSDPAVRDARLKKYWGKAQPERIAKLQSALVPFGFNTLGTGAQPAAHARRLSDEFWRTIERMSRTDMLDLLVAT